MQVGVRLSTCNTDLVLTLAKQGGSAKEKMLLFIMHMYLCIATSHSSCICTCAQLDSQHAQCHTMQSQLAARVLKLFVVRTLRERSKLGSSICSSQLKNKRSSLIAELRLGLSVCPKPFIPSAIRVLIIPPPSCHIKSCRHACLAAAAEPIWPHASL